MTDEERQNILTAIAMAEYFWERRNASTEYSEWIVYDREYIRWMKIYSILFDLSK